ncbi:MAG: hypothetical protein AB7D08_08530 [Bacteroidales bacterium]
MKNFYQDTLKSKVLSNYELPLVIALALLSGFIAKIPSFFGLDGDWFFPRNISFIVLPAMAIYFIAKSGLEWRRAVGVITLILLSALYINLLPGDDTRDTLVLSFIHMPLFLWSLTGYAFTGGNVKDGQQVTGFLRFNGDLAVIGVVIVIAGGILSFMTIGLFELIDMDIEDFYFGNIAIWGLAAVPVAGAYIVLNNPLLVKSVSPLIAKIFTPLVLVMLLVYLAAIVWTGKDPYNDREFLLIFNLLLVGVMALILFSVAESPGRVYTFLLLVLSVVTIIVNAVALSAIVFRISEWGISPNRVAVLGSNLLVLINLLLVTYRLFLAAKNPEQLSGAHLAIARFMPYYAIWTGVVTFLFPVIFGD